MGSKTFLDSLAEFLTIQIGDFYIGTYLFIAIVCIFLVGTVKKRIREVKENTDDYKVLKEFKQKNQELFTKENLRMAKKHYLKKVKDYFNNKK
ncbi:hypothetical protein [Virgibacillus siamensis]|uniref:hypothetical protein n=1 Tax=Virgibacillus siamensis TaxID=480071 RepID=UPI0009871145|nr:hypothetical protein [Virgibacillus siamensis]